MDRKRSRSLRELPSANTRDNTELNTEVAQQSISFGMGHSRNSSGTSSLASPNASTFSSRSHSRWPSSSSSLATSPDSPVNMAKSSLHDLVEHPAERDDITSYEAPPCMCDSAFCEHGRNPDLHHTGFNAFSLLPISDQSGFSSDGFADLPTAKRRGSNRNSQDSLSHRFNRHWPSISRRWRERKATTSMSSPDVRSAPPSRSPSFQGSFVQESLANYLGPLYAATSPTTPITSRPESTTSAVSVSAWHAFDNSFNASPHGITEDPIDREQLNSTPLLPPLVTDMRNQAVEVVPSPLQSPTVALHSAAGSVVSSPISSPQARALPTPPLSTKPSFASLGVGRVNHASFAYPAIGGNEADEFECFWRSQLGHSDFDINPKPYLPDRSDFATCRSLLEDWKAARKEFIRHAADISEHHGPNSKTYKLTGDKWRAIDAQWRSNFEQSTALARVGSGDGSLQPLPEMQSAPDMPSLAYDPSNPDKFLDIGKANMVGPMIQQQSRAQQKPAKRGGILKIITDLPSRLWKQ